MPVNSVQFGQNSWKYVNGLKLSNDATTPDEIVDIATGSILDSTGIYQIVVDTALTADNTVSGVGGLDTGTVAASKVYAVHVIADKTQANTPAALLSLSATAPQLPTGYNIFALVGYIVTDGSSDFLLGYWTGGNTGARQFVYDAPIICLSAGNSATYANVALTAFVPAVASTPVIIYSDWTANAAADILNYHGDGATGDQVTIIAPVAGGTAHTTQQNMVLAQLNSGAPTIEYKVSAGTVNAYVVGYQWFL